MISVSYCSRFTFQGAAHVAVEVTVHDEKQAVHMGFCNWFEIVISLLLVCKVIHANNVTKVLLKGPLISLVVSFFPYLSVFFVFYHRMMPFLVFLGGVYPITLKVITNLIDLLSIH